MMQEEVGQRLVAPVGAANYGALALAGRCYAEVDIVHRVPASCFVPRPKVDSAIVRFRCHEAPPVAGLNPGFFMKVVRAAFEQRRKTLRNSLTRPVRFGMAKEAILNGLRTAGIDEGRRPQSLSFDEFAALSMRLTIFEASWGRRPYCMGASDHAERTTNHHVQVLESLSSGVVVLDASGVLVDRNGAACQHLGVEPEDLPEGQPLDALPVGPELLAVFEEVRV